MNIKYIILVLALFLSRNTWANGDVNVIHVSSEGQLQQVLNEAKPGDEIIIEHGLYKGNFIIPATSNGTANKPIVLRGLSKVILDGGTTNSGYVLHLQANYWVIKDFVIINGLKGLMCDAANYNLIENLTVHTIGEEAIHFRRFSSHNTLQRCNIYHTGIKTADYGEGVYIGTAVSNWSKYTNGEEDKSDSNSVFNNIIGPDITAECIDIKEGTTGGLIKGNSFNSKGITGANSGDSWIDVKGNDYLIENNIGFNPKGSALKDGYQVHCAVNGWGNNNMFKNNQCEINGDG